MLSGCSQGIGMNRVVEGTTVSIGVLDTATTANREDAALGNPDAVTASADQLVGGLLYQSVLARVSPSPQFNTDFITVETAASDPLTVRYRLAEGMAWSDAVPTDDADLLLAWAAASEHFAPDGFVREEHLTGDGQLEVPDGAAWFDSAWSPMQAGTQLPVDDGDRRTLDVVYDEPVLEWELGIRQLLPAHVIARDALGIQDPMVAKQAVRDAILSEDADAIARLAQSHRELFSLRGDIGQGARVSNGPYLIDTVEPSGAVVLKPNKEFRLQTSAVSETIRVVPFESTSAMLDALRAGTIGVAIPDRSVEAWKEIEQLDRRGYQTAANGTAGFLRLDFNIAGGPEAGLFANRDVRHAFLSSIAAGDAEQVVTDAIESIDARNSWVFAPGHPESSISSEAAGFAQLTSLDEDEVAELLHQAGAENPKACVLYDSRSAERTAQFAVMQESAKEYGWTLADCGTEDWQSALAAGESWDVALTDDTTSGLHFDEMAARFETDGARNFTGFSSPELDQLIDTARHEADVYLRLDALSAIDRLLVEEAVAYPMHELPVLAVSSDAVTGVGMTDDAPYIGQDAFAWEVVR